MFKSPFSFNGRIGRLEYGLSYLIYFLLYFFMAFLWQELPKVSLLFYSLYILFIWFIMAQSAKRCHDLDQSGFYQLIPFYGLWLLFKEGDNDDNRFGPDPKKIIEFRGQENELPQSKTQNDNLKILINVSSPVLFNTLLIAFLIEYFDSNKITLFMWIFISVLIGYFLMLSLEYRGAELVNERKVLIKQRLAYSITLYICIRLYTMYFRNAEVYVQTIYFEIFIPILLLGFTYIPFILYQLLFKKKTSNYEV